MSIWRRKALWINGPLAVAVVVIGGVFYASATGGAASAAPQTSAVARSTVIATVSASGSVELGRDLGLSFTTGGKSSASTATGGLPAGLPCGFPGAGGLPGSGTGAGGAGSALGAGGFGGGGTVGTIKLVDGHTIYVQAFSGTITRVSTSASTKIQVIAAGNLKDLQPGETVVVQGSKRSDGSVAATSVSQSSLGGGGG